MENQTVGEVDYTGAHGIPVTPNYNASQRTEQMGNAFFCPCLWFKPWKKKQAKQNQIFL